ncbi:single-stranded DNA-binding protein [Mycolicibacterium mucogenicum]|uniref:single-stranded DNA-binding protein n=1 Tax=Mycolicibacterium mucogenicum TaxID=56689 RepID=UPI00226AB283|nr:single-stranded DNA-binding protein [Mycolicibacterium mucogenicum]MCX8557417.1 single-stranded DNA-binding protein [Mycolicibacterium mucogenicum]
MFETPFTVVGNVITDVVARRAGESNLATFRMASNSRKKTDDGWEPGNSLYVTVNCWGRVADGVAGRLFKGDPVVVVGYIFTNEYLDKEGNRRSSMEVRATSVGPDMARCQVKIDPRRPSPIELEQPQVEAQVASEPPETENSDALVLSA